MQTFIESSQKLQHGAWLEISLRRLLGNLRAIKQSLVPETQIFAVVKANAYGHGLKEVARALSKEVAYLGVSSIDEALELKEYGLETPVFLFGRTFSASLPAVITEGITLSVSGLEEAEEISEISLSLGRQTLVHIKIDTGMGRLGIPLREALSVIEKMGLLRGIILEGIYTHFPTAEKNDGLAETQAGDFLSLLETLEERGIRFRFRHACNSAASLKIRTPALNLVRPGLLLYGIYPDEAFRSIIHAEPILSLKSRIILLKRLQPGDSVGYGCSFVATRPTTIATLSIGYSHGYPFSASSRAYVLYRGKRYPLAGRVSMDYLAFTLGNDSAKVGEEVTLLGKNGDASISAEELANWAGTISYEIVTQLMPRLPRFYQ